MLPGFRGPPITQAGPPPEERSGPAIRGCNWLGDKRSQRIVTGTGDEAIPFATTTSVLLPAGVVLGTVNWVDELAPGAIETDVQLLVRA